MKRCTALILVLALTGCASAPKVVNLPVATPCQVQAPEKPQYVFPTLHRSDTIWVKSKALLADRQASLAYELELEAALNSCR